MITFQVTIGAAYAATYVITSRDVFHLFFCQHIFDAAQFEIWFFHNGIYLWFCLFFRVQLSLSCFGKAGNLLVGQQYLSVFIQKGTRRFLFALMAWWANPVIAQAILVPLRTSGAIHCTIR